MKLFGKMKIYIRKYIRKYMTVFCSLLLIPILSINSYALAPSFPQFNLNVTRLYCPELENWFSAGDDDIYSFVNNWNKSIDTLSLRLYASSDESDAYFSFPIIDGYDYYIYTSLGYIVNSSSTFIPTDFEILNRNDNSVLTVTDKQSFQFIYDDESSITTVNRYAFVGRLNIDNVNSFGSIRFTGNSGLLLERLFFECSIFLVPSGTDDAINELITAINNQTDIIENGNSGTQSSIDDFNQVFEDFNQELENIEEFDSQIIGEFESANEQYMAELNNFSLSSSLLNAGNWLSTSMQTVYDNSSDYKMLWLVPLLLGIPLIILFLKKGSDDE